VHAARRLRQVNPVNRKADNRECPALADLRRPALGTADPKPASQNVVLNVSKVAMNSPAGAPSIGQFRSLNRRENRAVSDRSLGTADIA